MLTESAGSHTFFGMKLKWLVKFLLGGCWGQGTFAEMAHGISIAAANITSGEILKVVIAKWRRYVYE